MHIHAKHTNKLLPSHDAAELLNDYYNTLICLIALVSVFGEPVKKIDYIATELNSVYTS